MSRDGESPHAHLSRSAAEDVRTVAKGGAVQIAGQVTQRSVTFVFSLIAFRVLGAAAYGIYRQVSQVLAIAAQIGLAGFNYASMRFIARARAREDHGAVRGAARVGLTGAAVASVIVFAALMVLANPLAGVFEDGEENVSELARLFRIGAIYVPLFALMQTLRYCTQAYKTMIPSVVAGNIVQPVVRFVFGIAALATGFAVAGVVASLVLSIAAGALAAGLYFRRMLTEEERRAVPRSEPRAMIRFALPQGGASLLGVQVLGLGIILLGALRSNAEVGLFGVAVSLQGPGNVFLGGIVNIWAPVVSDLYERGEIERLDSLYKTINRWIATFSFPVFVALILEPDLFVSVIFGPEGFGAESAVVALAIGNFFYTGTGPTGYVISMTGRPGVNMINSVVAVLLYVGLGLLIVPEHGILGMAVVDAIVTALVNTARVIEAKVLVGVQPFGRSFFKPVLASAVGGAVLLAWRLLPDETPVRIAGILVAAAAYLLTLRLLGLDPEEKHVWQRIKKRAFKRSGRKGA